MVDPDVIPGLFQTYHADLDPLVWNMRPSPDSPHLNQRFGGWNFGPQGSVEVIDADLDGDGMYDLWELDVGLDPTVDDGGGKCGRRRLLQSRGVPAPHGAYLGGYRW